MVLLEELIIQFGSVQSLDRLARQDGGEVGGNMTDDTAEILSHSFLQEAIVSSLYMGRDAHSLMLSTQHFLSCLPSRVSRQMVFERLL